MKRQVIGKRGVKLRNLNRRRAIRQHCHMCCDFDWQAVIGCVNVQCPLHVFRTGKGLSPYVDPKARAAAIGVFCFECAGGDHAVRSDCEALECALHPYREGRFETAQVCGADESPESDS